MPGKVLKKCQFLLGGTIFIRSRDTSHLRCFATMPGEKCGWKEEIRTSGIVEDVRPVRCIIPGRLRFFPGVHGTFFSFSQEPPDKGFSRTGLNTHCVYFFYDMRPVGGNDLQPFGIWRSSTDFKNQWIGVIGGTGKNDRNRSIRSFFPPWIYICGTVKNNGELMPGIQRRVFDSQQQPFPSGFQGVPARRGAA